MIPLEFPPLVVYAFDSKSSIDCRGFLQLPRRVFPCCFLVRDEHRFGSKHFVIRWAVDIELYKGQRPGRKHQRQSKDMHPQKTGVLKHGKLENPLNKNARWHMRYAIYIDLFGNTMKHLESRSLYTIVFGFTTVQGIQKLRFYQSMATIHKPYPKNDLPIQNTPMFPISFAALGIGKCKR